MTNQGISYKEILLLFLIVSLTIGLVLMGDYFQNVILFKNLSKPLNHQIIYQCSSVLLTGIFLLFLYVIKKDMFLTYFRKGMTDAPIKPVPIVGIRPKPHENWKNLGRNFAFIISMVTAALVYFQLIQPSNFNYNHFLKLLPLSLIFALSNAFVEEMITRFGVVVVLQSLLGDKYIALISGFIFGFVHYWGNPGGVFGVIFAGFLGWFLAKSILETKGVFWAWLIHFLQDIIIISALLNIQ
ncbi:CPBP family intramembrane glutamic endopeptidase [Crocinitomix algicola]|uniref:CPBP family intramembrane glutamic endopeptidase n=1 Tax=Crocinitomix algicola TaxID=1740263 RepID=UPI00082A0DDB|nr:CPBP family intramembrane glutamic endopeptidase [Crocinitomix algicola]